MEVSEEMKNRFNSGFFMKVQGGEVPVVDTTEQRLSGFLGYKQRAKFDS